METATRTQKKYVHRLKELVRSTQDINRIDSAEIPPTRSRSNHFFKEQ